MRLEKEITKDTIKIFAFDDTSLQVAYILLVKDGDVIYVNALYRFHAPAGIGKVLLQCGIHTAYDLWNLNKIKLAASGSNKKPDLTLYDSMSLQDLQNSLSTFTIQTEDREILIKAIESIRTLPRLEVYYEQFGFKRELKWDDPFVIYMSTTYHKFLSVITQI